MEVVDLTLSVFIADDERIQREGIVKHVPWQQLGMTIAGTAEDGEEALQKIGLLQPDILITDIKMPNMNGLELAAAVRQRYPRTRVIIISGYNEFEYARTAIELSANAYLLKPVNFDELLEVLRSVAAACLDEQRNDSERQNLSRMLEDNKPAVTGQFLRDLLYGQLLDPHAIADKALYLGIPEEGDFSLIIMVFEETNAGSGSSDRNKRQIYQTAQMKLKEFGKRFLWAGGFADEQELLWVVCASETGTREMLDHFRKDVNDTLHLNVTAGVSRVKSALSELPEAHREATIAVSQRFHVGKNLTFYNGDAINGRKNAEPVIRIKEIIEQQYAGTITVDELAKLVFLTPNYISNLFKEQTGETIIDYLTKIRMRHAAKLLEDPSCKIYEIAERTGFNSTSYFSVVFKNIYGQSPKEYRESLKGWRCGNEEAENS
ncbi:response regulator [Paenibacillus paridis]|uniref:response regulator n=1 Tax=Paenibacillus paridis TaxID=2583376 RepID=UPI00111FF1A3|nr:response regulator [Paenibacillus paridis]